jgi:hypothetical protein
MKEKVSIVVTSIFEPNVSLRALAKGAHQNNWDFIVIGDVKSPPNFSLEHTRYLNVEAQKQLGLKFPALCPTAHYSRKNIGYLLAIKEGSTIIVETDDDNIPREEFWKKREENLAATSVDGSGWFNAYSLFSDRPIWPRGLPLEKVLQNPDVKIIDQPAVQLSPIQQGLADSNPDVDAVFRMTYPLPHDFKTIAYPIRLSQKLWCPFNSQNTTWLKPAFPLLYLPSYCSFRMTDIWRSFIAQRIAWECGWQLVFHNATVFQERNEHNLLKDFEQEIPGYLLNEKIRKTLEDAPLKSGVDHIGHNLRTCYEILVRDNVITSKSELDLLEAWLHDLEKISQ